MQMLHQTVVVKRELCGIYQSLYMPTLTYDHGFSVAAERMRL